MMPPGIGYGQMYQQFQMGPQMGGLPGMGAPMAPGGGMPGGGGGMDFGRMYAAYGPGGGGVAGPATPGSWGQGYPNTQRPGLGDLGGLDKLMIGANVAGSVLDYLETRKARKESERQFNELMSEREREREEERRRVSAIEASWARATGGRR